MKKTILAGAALLALFAAMQPALALDGRGPGGDSGVNNGGAPDGRGSGGDSGSGGGE